MSGTGTLAYLSAEEFRESKGIIVDVRSPEEFIKGHWPGAVNIPIFSDEERAIVGKTYKVQGKEKATAIGLKLTISKLSKIEVLLKRISNNNHPGIKADQSRPLKIYCWRGGMRSASIAWFANQLGLKTFLLKNGYKAYRNWVLQQFECKWPIKIIGGKTGTGKTDLLNALSEKGFPILDLEGLANHRGSSFGGLGLPKQPTSQHYENMIAEHLNNFKSNIQQCIWVEDERSNLGKCRIPQKLLDQMKVAPFVEIIRDKNERIQHLVKGYSENSKKGLTEATLRISKRLGKERAYKATNAIDKGDWPKACSYILDYYDKCYEYQLSKISNKRIINLTGLNIEFSVKEFIDNMI